jgi:hypothetical protein
MENYFPDTKIRRDLGIRSLPIQQGGGTHVFWYGVSLQMLQECLAGLVGKLNLN